MANKNIDLGAHRNPDTLAKLQAAEKALKAKQEQDYIDMNISNQVQRILVHSTALPALWSAGGKQPLGLDWNHHMFACVPDYLQAVLEPPFFCLLDTRFF